MLRRGEEAGCWRVGRSAAGEIRLRRVKAALCRVAARGVFSVVKQR